MQTICDLLIKANLLDAPMLGPIMVECTQKQITPGEYLYSSGAMDLRLVRAAIICQLLVNDRLLPLITATQALQMVARQSVSLEEALQKCGWNGLFYEHLGLIGKLLQFSGRIPREECIAAYEICIEKQSPILPVLVERKLISYSLANDVLVLEKLIVHEIIGMDVAIEVLKALKDDVSLEAALVQHCGSSCKVDREILLGELLAAAEIVSSGRLVSCIERSVYEPCKLGQVLIAEGLLTQELLDTGLAIQKQLVDGKLSTLEAVKKLKKAAGKK